MEYDMIKACGLCRQLITEKRNLVDQINRKYNIDLIFTVVDWEEFSKLRTQILWITIDPTNRSNDKTLQLNLEQFHAHVLLKFHQFDFTVKDVIRFVSHLMGGIHSGIPEHVNERAFLAFNKAIDESSPPLIVYAIKAICTVIIKAMEPLEIAVKNETLSK
ncbi:MAG: hypothetical protein ACXWCZ_10305 [Flavisolibacter sp.]